MDIPAAAPAQLSNQPDSDIRSPTSAPLTWITFGGSPEESLSDFVQFIQRTAFQQNRIGDDKWIAAYASTCFSGDALFWFLELEEITQESWKKLRLALTRRFPPPSRTEETVITRVPAPTSFIPTPASSSISGVSGKRGIIEVVSESAETIGYLNFDRSLGISITPSEAKAVIITPPDPISSDPCHFQMVGLPGPSALFPFLGLVLVSNHHQAGDNQIPSRFGHSSINGRLNQLFPVTSSICQAKPLPPRNSSGRPPTMATWSWSNCGKSRASQILRRKSATPFPNTRAMAAIWRYDGKSDDLKITWLMDDHKECELGAYVHRGTNKNVHAHRIDDMPVTRDCLDEERAHFVFKSI